MKNKKIIAMLCVMTMLITTLSSLFIVTAQAEPTPTLKVTIGDADEDGNYPVTVGYEGIPDTAKINTFEANVTLPAGVTVVDKSLVVPTGATKKIAATAVRVAWGTADEDLYITGSANTLYTFKIAKPTAAGELTLADTAYIQDKADEGLVTYGFNGTAVTVVKAILPFVEEQGDRSAIIMKSKTNEDGTKTVTVSMDMTNAKIENILIKSMQFSVVITGADDPVVLNEKGKIVAKSLVDGGTIAYASKAKKVNFAYGSSDGLEEAVVDLFTFNVNKDIDVTLTIDKEPTLNLISVRLPDGKDDDYKFEGVADDHLLFAAPLQIKAKEDTTPTPTPDGNETPTPGTDTPDKTPAPTEAPKPITIPDTAVVATTAPIVGSTGGASTKSYSIKLGDFKFDPADPAIKDVKNVIVSMQGLKNDGTAVGFVFIEVPIDDLKEGSGKVFNGGVPGADKVSVNVYDAANPKNVLNNAKITK